VLFSYIVRKLRFLYNYKPPLHPDASDDGVQQEKVAPSKVSDKLCRNLENMRSLFCNSNDFKVHSFRIGGADGVEGALLYIDGLVDNMLVTQGILNPLLEKPFANIKSLKTAELMQVLQQDTLRIAEIKEAFSLAELSSGILLGDTVLLLDGCEAGLIINSKGYDMRQVSEPESEVVVRGPREGFTENLRTNTALVRRKIRNGQLRVEQMVLGRKTQTQICLVYLSGVANEKVIAKVKGRLVRLDIESVLESGYIEEYIEDAPFSPFATLGYTEKPDVVAARILEGRVAILVDGTPFALTAPMFFIESFQSSEDYYLRPLYASFIRSLRYIAFVLTVFAPAFYIALTSFHHALIPLNLLFSISIAREGTPFPVFVEALIMVFAFEVLREAGVRLPRAVGQAISIVGALVMGDAAVSAGLVGAPIVITIAITAVASFLIPGQNDASSLLRVIMMVLAGFLGFYGLAMGFLGMLIHLASLESFGVPYFDSFNYPTGVQDSVMRIPLWAMLRRPKGIAYGDTTKGRFFIPPLRPHTEDEDTE